jgi:glycosyltransferase involved in cell wall biosynthesis
MQRLLFISNDTKPSEEEYNYIGEEKLTSFSIPSVKAALGCGLGITIGVNRKNAPQLTCKYPVSFYNAEIYRNPYNIIEVYRAYKNTSIELKKGDYIGIHCNTPIGGVIGRIAGHKHKIKNIIYTAHGFHFYKGAPFINWLLYYPIEKILARWTDSIITINLEDYEFAKKHLRSRIYYVPGVGIDLEQWKNYKNIRENIGLNVRDFVILVVGRLERNKNCGTIIDAIAKVPDVKIVFCGDGEDRQMLVEKANKLGLKDRVIFLGNRTDMSDIYHMADCFVMASFREGLSRSIMEAMACGLPCIVSNIRGNRDLIADGQGGFLFVPKDTVQLSKLIEELYYSTELRERFCKYNLEKIKNFSCEKVINKLYDIYSEQFIV